MRIYLSNLPWSITEDELLRLVADYGEPEKIDLRKGLAFIDMNAEDGTRAIAGLTGRSIDGKTLNARDLAISPTGPAGSKLGMQFNFRRGAHEPIGAWSDDPGVLRWQREYAERARFYGHLAFPPMTGEEGQWLHNYPPVGKHAEMPVDLHDMLNNKITNAKYPAEIPPFPPQLQEQLQVDLRDLGDGSVRISIEGTYQPPPELSRRQEVNLTRLGRDIPPNAYAYRYGAEAKVRLVVTTLPLCFVNQTEATKREWEDPPAPKATLHPLIGIRLDLPSEPGPVLEEHVEADVYSADRDHIVELSSVCCLEPVPFYPRRSCIVETWTSESYRPSI